MHVPINETVTCNNYCCDLQNVICQTNISYFENYKKRLKLKLNSFSKTTIIINSSLSLILSIYMYTIIILYSLRYSKVTSLFEVGIIVYLFHPICWPHLVIFHGSAPLKCTWGYIHLLNHSHQVLTIKANHPKRLSILLNLDPSRKVYKTIVKSKC